MARKNSSDGEEGGSSGGRGVLGAFARRSMHKKKKKAEVEPSKLAPPTADSAFTAVLGAPLVHRHHLSGSSSYRHARPRKLEKLSTLRSTKPAQRGAMFLKKLAQCTVVFDFEGDALSDLASKEIKRKALEEMIDYVSSPKSTVTPEMYPEIVGMFAANVFRCTPPPTLTFGAEYDPEEDEPTLLPQWPHLQLVYEFFLSFVESGAFDAAAAAPLINKGFVVQMLELFDSEDPRERDMLKTLLHRIYGNFLPLRAFIRQSINNLFCKFIYEQPGTHNGIAELLEILGSIINGFAVPLKEEHKTFLRRVLLPMHKVKSLAIMHPQLAYCVVQFVDKDPALAVPVVNALLRYWPKLKSPKQVMFLNELEAVIEVTNGPEFKEVAAGIVRQIAAGINTLHFQVAERCLYLWNNDHLQELVKPMAEDLIPLIFPALHKHSQSHWNRNTLGLSFSVLNGLSDRHPAIIERCTEQLPTSAKLSSETRMRLDMAWARLEQEAQRNPVAREVGGLIHPTGPAASRHPVTDGLSEAKVLRDIPGPMDHKMLSKTKMRRKSFLPRDEEVAAALQQHHVHSIGLPSTPTE